MWTVIKLFANVTENFTNRSLSVRNLNGYFMVAQHSIYSLNLSAIKVLYFFLDVKTNSFSFFKYFTFFPEDEELFKNC